MKKYQINIPLTIKQKIYRIAEELIEKRDWIEHQMSNLPPTDPKLLELRDEWVEKLIEKRDWIEHQMSDLPPTDPKLLELRDEWVENEFRLQETWKFGRNADYHREFNLPHCKCAKMDNEDYVGTSLRSINPACIYHGGVFRAEEIPEEAKNSIQALSLASEGLLAMGRQILKEAHNKLSKTKKE